LGKIIGTSSHLIGPLRALQRQRVYEHHCNRCH